MNPIIRRLNILDTDYAAFIDPRNQQRNRVNSEQNPCPTPQNTLNYRLWTIELSTLDEQWCLTIYQPPGFYVGHWHLNCSRDEAISTAKAYIDQAIGSPYPWQKTNLKLIKDL